MKKLEGKYTMKICTYYLKELSCRSLIERLRSIFSLKLGVLCRDHDLTSLTRCFAILFDSPPFN